MKKTILPGLAIIALLLAGAVQAAGEPSESAAKNPAQDKSKESTATRAAKKENSGSFTGRNGLVRVGSDTIEAHDGNLTVNGIPHGKVDDTSVVKYTAKGKKKSLTVNGVPRLPNPTAAREPVPKS